MYCKPAYLEAITDPSFGTGIRRITDAGDGNAIKIPKKQIPNSKKKQFVSIREIRVQTTCRRYKNERGKPPLAPDDFEPIL